MTTTDRSRHRSGALSCSRGMPLHELLTAALICGVLAAILAPVLVRARLASPTQICMANLQQLGAAFGQYARDWDDSYPPNRFCRTPAPCDIKLGGLEGSPYNWKRALTASGYVPSVQVWSCPSNPDKWAPADADGCIGDESNCAGASKSPTGLQLPNGYAYNSAFFHEQFGVRRITDIENPALLIMVLESRTTYPDLGDWAADSIFAHPGHRANWLFADGKVRSLKLIETVRPVYLWRDPHDKTRSLTPAAIPASLR